MIWTIKVIRLRYRSLRAALRFAELSEIFYELLRARGDGHGLGEIKRVSANVKAQFPADGYELMEDVKTQMQTKTRFQFRAVEEMPGVRLRLLRRRDDDGNYRRTVERCISALSIRGPSSSSSFSLSRSRV